MEKNAKPFSFMGSYFMLVNELRICLFFILSGDA
jgi:hypothetical protein